MSEASNLSDDAFRSCTIGFIQCVSPAVLHGSSNKRIELRVLANEYLNTSRDVNMQELLAMLHSRYDLVKLGCYEPEFLEDITARVYRTARSVEVDTVNAGSDTGASGSSNEVGRGSMASGFKEDAVGVGAHVADGIALPTKLGDDSLGFDTGEAAKANKTQNKNAYLVGWKRRC